MTKSILPALIENKAAWLCSSIRHVRRWQEHTGKQAVHDGDGRPFSRVSEERIGATGVAAKSGKTATTA
jgi:hypothetical protein